MSEQTQEATLGEKVRWAIGMIFQTLRCYPKLTFPTIECSFWSTVLACLVHLTFLPDLLQTGSEPSSQQGTRTFKKNVTIQNSTLCLSNSLKQAMQDTARHPIVTFPQEEILSLFLYPLLQCVLGCFIAPQKCSTRQ